MEGALKYVSLILALLTAIANTVEIVIIAKKKNKLHSSMIYILNLSISDLLTAVCTLIIVIIRLVRSFPSLTEVIIYQIIFTSSIMTSSFNLVAITIDRILAIIRPIQHRNVKRVYSVSVCICLWLVSVVSLSIVYTVALLHPSKSGYNAILILYPTTTFTTVIILCGGYYWLIKSLKGQRHDLISKMQSKNYNTLQQHSSHLERKMIKSEWKIIKLSMVIVFAFFICWMPFSVYCIVIVCDRQLFNGYVIHSLLILALSNSFLNPLLYFHHFRKEIVKVFAKIKKLRWRQI